MIDRWRVGDHHHALLPPTRTPHRALLQALPHAPHRANIFSHCSFTYAVRATPGAPYTHTHHTAFFAPRALRALRCRSRAACRGAGALDLVERDYRLRGTAGRVWFAFAMAYATACGRFSSATCLAIGLRFLVHTGLATCCSRLVYNTVRASVNGWILRLRFAGWASRTTATSWKTRTVGAAGRRLHCWDTMVYG